MLRYLEQLILNNLSLRDEEEEKKTQMLRCILFTVKETSNLMITCIN